MTPGKTLSLPLDALYPLIEEALESGREVYIAVRGSSMRPFLHDLRDQAVFAPVGSRTIRKGDIVFYQRDSGQFVMHRVYAVDGEGVMTIVGDAQQALEKGVRPDQLRAYVTRVVRKGREISCEKGMWRLIMTLYQMRIRYPHLVRMGIRLLRLPIRMYRKIVRKK